MKICNFVFFSCFLIAYKLVTYVHIFWIQMFFRFLLETVLLKEHLILQFINLVIRNHYDGIDWQIFVLNSKNKLIKPYRNLKMAGIPFGTMEKKHSNCGFAT